MARCNLVYADDVLCALAHSEAEVVAEAAGESAEVHSEELKDLGLQTAKVKSENFAMNPNVGEWSIFRRAPKGERTAHRTGGSGADQGIATNAEAGSREMEMLEVNLPGKVIGELPYSVVSRFRLLGVVFDENFRFQDHVSQILEKAKIRLAILAKVSSNSWGLDTGMLRLTGKALVLSLLRYGLTVTGSGMNDKDMQRIDTRVVNVLARRILGVGPSARLPVLHAVAGVESMNNLYVQNCAAMLNIALRAERSSLQTRMNRWLCRAYEVRSWRSHPEILAPPATLIPQIGRLRFLDYDINECWVCQDLEDPPQLGDRFVVDSTYYSGAQEIRSKPNLLAQTYDYERVTSWFDIAVQVAVASGWRPDCSTGSMGLEGKKLPPLGGNPCFYIDSYRPMGSAKGKQSVEIAVERWRNGSNKGLSITTGAFYQNGAGVSGAWINEPGKVPCTQVWMLGEDRVSLRPPSFVLEASVLHALLVTEEKIEAEGNCYEYIVIKAGNWKTNRMLVRWFEEE